MSSLHVDQKQFHAGFMNPSPWSQVSPLENIQNGCNCLFVAQRWIYLLLSRENVWVRSTGDTSVHVVHYARMRWDKDEIMRLPDCSLPYHLFGHDSR
eukprot:894047-Karenia_brevis.AAC.1